MVPGAPPLAVLGAPPVGPKGGVLRGKALAAAKAAGAPPTLSPAPGGPGVALMCAALGGVSGLASLPAPTFPPLAPLGAGSSSSGSSQAFDSAWVKATPSPAAVDAVPLTAGSIVEIATYSPSGVLNGTALFQITACSKSTEGTACEVLFGGASEPAVTITLDGIFSGPASGGTHGLLHLCRSAQNSCPFTDALGRPVMHADTFRSRVPSRLSEVWIKPLFRSFVVPEPLPVPPQEPLKPAKVKGVGAQLAVAAQMHGLKQEVRREKERQKKKKQKKKRRRKSAEDDDGAASSSSSDESSTSSGKQLFRTGSAVMRLAIEKPGHLYRTGIREMQRLLGNSALPEDSSHPVAPVMVTYFQTLLLGQTPPDKVGQRTLQELRTIAAALDHLAKGQLDQQADLLMQRFKALELSVKEQSWVLASELELLPPYDAVLTSHSEHRKAAQAALLKDKLLEAKRKLKSPK